MDIKVDLLQWLTNIFDKETSDGVVRNEIMSNKELVEELHKPIIRKFENQKVNLSFIDNIWTAGLADMELISQFNEVYRFLFCVIDICSKYAWPIPLKDKKGITIANAFQKILNESNGKLNKIYIDKGSKFYIRSVKSWLQDNDVEMNSAHINKENLLLMKDLLEP